MGIRIEFRFRKTIQNLVFVLLAAFMLPKNASATFYSIDPSYLDPTDLASGGASLTFATNEGMVFSNPALMAISPETLRWLGTRFSLMPSAGAINIVSGEIPEFDANDLENSIDSLTALDLGFGTASTLLTFITSNFAIVPIASDLKIGFGFDKFGSVDSGTASLEAFVDFENKMGAGIAFAGMPTRWWSLGLTLRGLMVTEETIIVPLNIAAVAADPEAAATSLNSAVSAATDGFGANQVIGYDIGSVLFFQGETIDYRIATVIRDVGGATISEGSIPGFTGGSTDPSQFSKPQAIDVGLGVTFHTASSFIHLAADIRDYQNVYGEPDFKRYAFGLKSHIARWVALGAGVRHGHPTYGIEMDLIMMRLSLSNYFEVIGDDPLGKKRNYYNISFAFGTDF